MYKALGIVLVFLSLGIFSYKTVEKKRQQLINLKEFRRALGFLKNELSFSMPEISVLCKKVSNNTAGEISSLFKSIEHKILTDSRVDFSTAWKANTDKNVLFSPDATKEILNFVENFGKKTLDIELENIKRCEKALEELTQEENDKYIKEKKLIYTFGAALGAVIVILGI